MPAVDPIQPVATVRYRAFRYLAVAYAPHQEPYPNPPGTTHTAASLGRLWESQCKGRDVHELLAPVYNCFTEGFDCPDLRKANAFVR